VQLPPEDCDRLVRALTGRSEHVGELGPRHVSRWLAFRSACRPADS
jgi:hypothetical protein